MKGAKKKTAKKSITKKKVVKAPIARKSTARSNGSGVVTWNFKLLSHHMLGGFGGMGEEIGRASCRERV